jgi:S-adenosylmethionine:tRNA ribosyltransferase-isomerase
MDVHDFDFDLPPELIAQEPPPERGGARLLVVERATGALTHTHVAALPDILRAGDLVVVNNTRVFPARLLGRRVPSGGAVECLLVRRVADQRDRTPAGGQPDGNPVATGRQPGRDREVIGSDLGAAANEFWEALVHPGQKLKPGARVVFDGTHTIHGEILDRRFFGRRLVGLWTDDGSSVDEAVDAIGHVPLPPYIRRADRPEDRDRYQTVFAHQRGSIAAPTAGLHFNPALVAALRDRGIELAEITLHVGYGTFQPVRAARVEDHRIDAEEYDVSAAAALAISRARADRRRVIAVGTTTTRTLEAIARAHGGDIVAGRGATDLFIYPGFAFQVIAGLLTNFHLSQSSLLMLVSAFAGRERIRTAYDAAIAARYRFYSYGDAMLVL